MALWVYSVFFIEKSPRGKNFRVPPGRVDFKKIKNVQIQKLARPSRVRLLPHGSVFLNILAIRIMISTMATVPIIRNIQSNLLNGFSIYSVTG